MKTKVHKIGNSLSIYIPKSLALKTGLTKGAPVELRSVGPRIIVEPALPKETLDDLLASLTPNNRNEFVDFGPDVGQEIIKS